MRSLRVDIQNSRYQALIGVGGIGTGVFFALDGSHTLGREESRSGHYLERRDYCKLHIITHYVRTLLGPDFQTFLVGKVGDDTEGQQLLHEISDTGLDLRHVEVVPGGQTLFSFCFVYPDGTGGNLTTDNSVNATLDAAYVDRAVPQFERFRQQGVALAAPETSLAARNRLLTLATEHGFLRVASLTSSELASPQGHDILAQTDLLAINLDEAAVLAGMSPRQDAAPDIVRAATRASRRFNENMIVSVTAGRDGSWLAAGEETYVQRSLDVEAVGTAGAGDAHLGGLIAGIVAGLSLPRAHELATLVAAASVTSPHTINDQLDASFLRRLISDLSLEPSEEVKRLLGEPGEL